MELCTQTIAISEVITRRIGNRHPSVWGDHFLAYAELTGANEQEEKQHANLKEEVTKMLVMSPSKSIQKLEVINTIQRLGVDYHFEHEIQESLSYLSEGYEEWIGEVDNANNLHVVSLSFRLLRVQGYYVSCDAYRKFTDEQGNYKEALVRDVQGMLSLYEAAQFRVHDEQILDEAMNFTTTQLKLILPNLNNSLAQQVSSAFKFSIRDGIVRLEAWKYISIYKEDKSCNQVLLNFAKLDFNILQMLHKKELCDITRWWKELELVKVVPYARDRVVELYFWCLGIYFEPQYNVSRKILTKVLSFCSIMDTYDTYGTLNELTLLTNAIERWNIDASEQLPPYMKITYHALLDVYNEMEKELTNKNKSLIFVNYSINEMKKLLKAYFQETKWYHGKIVPKMEQYVKNGALSSTYHLLATTFLLGMGDVATKDAFDWIATEPPILVASGIIARLLNDLVSHEIEQERGDAASGIECYMNEYGVTKEKAHMEIRKIIANYWKDLNEDYLKHIVVIPRVLLMVMLNLTRTAEFVYKDEDAYSFSNNNLKYVISMLLIHPIIT